MSKSEKIKKELQKYFEKKGYKYIYVDVTYIPNFQNNGYRIITKDTYSGGSEEFFIKNIDEFFPLADNSTFFDNLV